MTGASVPRMKVRRTGPEEWKGLREIRLRALADSPDAFGATVERDRRLPWTVWRRRADRGWFGMDGVTLVADERGTWRGLVSCGVEEERPGRIHVVAMWVEPAARGRGLGRSLMQAAIDWGRERGKDDVELWVAETNEPAILLYRAMGFQELRGRKPLPSNPSLLEFRMRRPL